MNPKRKNWTPLRWEPTLDGWIKINIYAFRRHFTRFTSVGYVLRHNVKVIIAKGKKIGDCPILVDEDVVVREVVLMAIQMKIKIKVTLNWS